MGWSNAGWRSDQGGWYKNAVAAPAFTTFDPANTDAGLTLSNGNLTATMAGSSAARSTRSIASHSTGKYYFEFVVNGGGFNLVGICNGTFNVSGAVQAGFDANNSFGSDGTGSNYINTSSIGSSWGWIAGDNMGVAVDLTAKLFWIKDITFSQPWNNNGSADPATGVGGINISTLNAGPYFAVATLGANAGVDTANFGASAYALTPPSGFGNW